jgi:smad nuclear-interacting protein 1
MSHQISDAEAMRALLSSAETRDRERNEQGNKRKPDRWGNSNKTKYHSRQQGDYNKRNRRNDNTDRTSSNKNDASYYGPSSSRQQQQDQDNNNNNNQEQQDESKEEEERAPPEHKANFGLSGALTKDEGGGGNVYKGVVLKFREPPEARCPTMPWRFYLFKGKELLNTLHISKQSAYLMGRNEKIADIPMVHPSLSSQHAVLQYRALPSVDSGRLSCQPYIMDLESTNGTFLNDVKIDSARYYQLKKGDVLKFGASTREYVLMKAEGTK